LAGVRRTGKTTLARSVLRSKYFNCDDFEVQEQLKNPVDFFRQVQSTRIVFDEIHQLDNASQVLKIAHDEFPKLKVLATGSSTLVASKKFKDSLTGRKRNLHFVPILPIELEDFGVGIEKRMLHGGLPPALLSKTIDREFYSEWLDSFYARDVQEIFAIEKRQAFLKVLEFLLVRNGRQIELTEIGKVAGITRPSVAKYLDVLEATKAISVIRPFSSNPSKEIVSQPKVYGFDTGFVCFAKGESDLGSTEKGHLLENLVLETLQAKQLHRDIRYWRDKQGAEVDFVIPFSKNEVLTIECKSKSREFSISSLEKFRAVYPRGPNWVITLDDYSKTQKTGSLTVRFMNIKSLFSILDQQF